MKLSGAAVAGTKRKPTAKPVDPARDCPPCPNCGGRLGTPICDDTGRSPRSGRWVGPVDATLYCPACGCGWMGTAADLAQAWNAWHAYEQEQEGYKHPEAAERLRKFRDARKYSPGGLMSVEETILNEAIAHLENT